MSSSTGTLGVPLQGSASRGNVAPRQYSVPCPACGTAARVQEGGPETDRMACEGCGGQLVILRTDTMFMAVIPTPLR